MGAESALNFPASQLLAVLERAVGGEAPAAGWLVALAEHDGPLIRSVPGVPDVDALLLAARAGTSGEGQALTRSGVAGLATEQAAREGRPLVTTRDIAAVLLKAAEPPAAALAAPPASIAKGAAGPAGEVAGPASGAPGGLARTFRVFVSSTFSDFAAERDALRRQVWPRLRAYCTAQGARFQEVDLRWGVSEEAAADQQTMNICMKEVERCRAASPRPNFLILLGNRYGWMPPPPQIPAGEWHLVAAELSEEDRQFLQQWYSYDGNAEPPEYRLRARTGALIDGKAWEKEEARLHRLLAGAVAHLPLAEERRRAYLASATDQEIAVGAVEPLDQVVCFSRDIHGYPDVPANNPGVRASRYADPDQRPVRSLKERLGVLLGSERVIEETVEWAGDGPEIDEAYLTRVTGGIYAALRATIAEELAHPRRGAPGSVSGAGPGLDGEGLAHRDFAAERARFFTGRAAELDHIAGYLRGGAPRPLVLCGDGGTGKSALLPAAASNAAQHLPGCAVVARFVGATPASTDGRALLGGICRELARRAGEAEAGVPGDYAELAADFTARLGKATASRPIVVFVDSLDQLPASGTARSLSWIPIQLPPHARLVLSTRPGDTFAPLQRTAEVLEVRGLPAADGKALLTTWLHDARRTLQQPQRALVLDSFQQSAGNPLYLRLAFEEACRWTSGDRQPPQSLAIGVADLIRANLFRHLEREDQHGTVLIAHALGYLAASRYGLAEDELLDLLSRDIDVYGWFLARTFHIPTDLLDLAVSYREQHETSPAAEDGSAQPDARRAAAQWIELIRKDLARGDELRGFLTEVLTDAGGPRLPAVFWSRLYYDLEPYLAERRAEGADLLAFHHREIGDAARAVYAAGEAGPLLHSRLADYFRASADPQQDRAWGAGTGRAGLRGLSELPHHLIRAGRWENLEDTLTDFAFLEQKAARVGVVNHGEETVYTGVFQLQDDFEEALQCLPGAREEASGRPRIIVTAVDLGDGLVIRCPHCNTIRRFQEEWLGQEIGCPNPDCAGPLQVNPFVVERSAV
jgi:hypothetical protein